MRPEYPDKYWSSRDVRDKNWKRVLIYLARPGVSDSIKRIERRAARRRTKERFRWWQDEF